jgi:hypothetical protein
MAIDQQIERFAALFDGNERSHGVWSPKTGKMHTQPRPAVIEDYAGHVAGKMGLGVVPITDANECYFGVIDIDNHGTTIDLPLADVAALAASRKLPLVCARSKSGGIHAYVFCERPLSARTLRRKMVGWARDLGYPKAEIYPRQDTLRDESDGSRQLGNWINLPYHDAEITVRYAWIDGKRASLLEFLDYAESLLQTAGAIDGTHPDHPEAPPCIQRLLSEGLDSGARNEGLYNVVVYLKKAYPEDYRDRAFDVNTQAFQPPLPTVEARRTIASAARRDYKYKCDEDPIKSLCNRPVCLTRKFGIGSTDDINGKNHGALPVFTNLVKYATDPVRWSIQMDEVVVDNLATDDILKYTHMEKIIVERLGRGAPMLKERDWRAIINVMLETHRVVEIPDDASSGGIIRAKLVDYAKKAVASLGVDELDEDRTVLLRGLPIIYRTADGTEYVAFRGTDFVEFLKRNRSEELKGTNIYFAIKNMGVEQHNVRVNKNTVIKCWCIPMNAEWRKSIQPVSFTTEF